MSKTFLRTVIVALLLGAAAQAADTARRSAAASDQPTSANKSGGSSTSKVDYILQPLDLLKIQVFQEDDLTREVRLSQEASATLPLIGTVDFTGKTRRQAEEYVSSLYLSREFLKNPQVTILVVEYAPRRVSVSGAVNQAGAITFHQEQGLTLVEAIAKAQGQNRYADLKKVSLKRRNPDGTTTTYTINVQDLMKGDSNEVWPLEPNDVIFVPDKIL